MITILIPLYNGIEYLPDALNSIISQTYTDWLVLIGINGHGDKSEDIVNKIKEISIAKDPRIIVIVQPPEINNKSKSLNHLNKMVTTEWVALLDADDIWLPTKLERQIEVINKTDCEVIGTHCEYFGERSGSPSLPLGLIPRGSTLNYNPIINSSVLLKTKYGRWDELLATEGYEDYDLWLKLDVSRVKMYNVPEILVKHRLYKESFFNTKTADTALLKQKYIRLFNYT